MVYCDANFLSVHCVLSLKLGLPIDLIKHPINQFSESLRVFVILLIGYIKHNSEIYLLIAIQFKTQ